MSRDLVDEAYRSGVLRPDKHARMVADVDRWAERAGVPAAAILTHLSEYVDEPERAWVMEVVKARLGALPRGLVYVGRWRDVDRRMAGIAGAMVRNFIDARVMSAHQVVEDPPDCRVLLIPNFHPGGKGRMASWKASELADVVLDRARNGKATVLHVDALEDVRADYGDELADMMTRSLKVVKR